MVTAFDTVFRDVAKNLISLFGVTSTAGEYTSIAFSAIDVDTSAPTGNVSTTLPLNMSPPLKFAIGDVDGTTITTKDMQIIIAGPDWDAQFSVQPTVNDILKVNGLAFRVINPNPIYSGNLVAAYKMQVRAGHAD